MQNIKGMEKRHISGNEFDGIRTCDLISKLMILSSGVNLFNSRKRSLI